MDQTSSPGQASQTGDDLERGGSPGRRCSNDSSESTEGLDGIRDDAQQEPGRKDTASSTATLATTITTQGSGETVTTSYSLEPSPGSLAASQARFSISKGSEGDQARRPSSSRRRTGPLTGEQRKRASLIRKIGACDSCKRRRVACDPAHRNTSWDAVINERMPEIATVRQGSRNLSPVFSITGRQSFSHASADIMDVEQSPHGGFDPPTVLGRTPLPSSPRLHKPINMVPIPGQDAFRADLQGSASRIAANPLRSRYARVSVLMACWQDDEDDDVKRAMQELAEVFQTHYNYKAIEVLIPTNSDGKDKSATWLTSRVINWLMGDNERDVLKIFFYTGHSYLGGDRDTILASSKTANPESGIPWQGIQQLFENVCTDSLLIMDCAYYPMYQKARSKGMLEIIAASAGQDPVELLKRGSFARIIAEQLGTRALQKFRDPFTVSSLHANLLSEYAKFFQNHDPEKEIVSSVPTPIFLQQSSNKFLPSIPLSPLSKGMGSGSVFTPESPTSGANIRLTFTLSENTFQLERWSEWLRSMPEGIKDVKVEGPYRDTFR